MMEKKTLPTSAVLLMVIFTAVTACLITAMVGWLTPIGKGPDYGVLDEINSLVDEYYLGETDRKSVNEWIAKGYVEGLDDKYGFYMTAEEYKEYKSSNAGEGSGIGVRVTYDAADKTLTVVSVIPSTSAEKAGLQKGDLIFAVDGKYVSDITYDEVLTMLKGDVGTEHNVEIKRGEENFTVSLINQNYDAPTVEYWCYSGESDKKTGVIRIYEFGDKTASEFQYAILSLISEGALQFVFDVRDNAGGSLDTVVDMLDHLLPDGPIVKLVDKDGETVRTYVSEKSQVSYPMAVLTNENSASASELFVSALRDYKKAFSVGKKTYGKGTAMTVFELSDGSALAISTYLYETAYSENFEGVGVSPDYEVDIPEGVDYRLLEDHEDTQLAEAVRLLDLGATVRE